MQLQIACVIKQSIKFCRLTLHRLVLVFINIFSCIQGNKLLILLLEFNGTAAIFIQLIQ